MADLRSRRRDEPAKLPGTTVHRETARKRAAAEAERQASTEGAGGGKAQGRLAKKDSPKGPPKRGSRDEDQHTKSKAKKPTTHTLGRTGKIEGGQSKVISKIADILKHAADASSEGGEVSSSKAKGGRGPGTARKGSSGALARRRQKSGEGTRSTPGGKSGVSRRSNVTRDPERKRQSQSFRPGSRRGR